MTPAQIRKNLALANAEEQRILAVMKGLAKIGEPQDGDAMKDMRRKLKANRAWRTRFVNKYGKGT